MPKGIKEFYTFRGGEKICETTVSQGQKDMYPARLVTTFHTERSSAAENTLFVKYAITPTEGGDTDFWYHYTFSQDAPIESVLETLNTNSDIKNTNSEEFAFTIDTPSWTNKLKCEVNHAGQTIVFKATQGLAYKMGLTPDKEYTLSDTDGDVTIGDYTVMTTDSVYYDLSINGIKVARSFPTEIFQKTIMYGVYLENNDQVNDFVVMDNNNRRVDIAFSVEIAYIKTDVNFRMSRFNIPGENNHIYTNGYKEAGFREIVVFDNKHLINSNDTALSYFGYNLFTKADFNNAYLTDNFELSTDLNNAMVDVNLGTNQANVEYYCVVGATLNGRRHVDLTVLPFDSSMDIITVSAVKIITNKLVSSVAKPLIQIDGSQWNIPGNLELLTIQSTEVNTGFANETILQKLVNDTPITQITQGNPDTTMVNGNGMQKFILIGAQAVKEYLLEFDAFGVRRDFYETFCDTSCFNVLDNTYVFEQTCTMDEQVLFYCIEYDNHRTFVNELSLSDTLLWMENIPDYYDVKCYAHSATGKVLYEVEDFSFELILR